MSYTSLDFPHTHFYDSDLREVLGKIKFLLTEYDKLVNDIADLNEWREQHKEEYQELVRRVSVVENEIATFETQMRQLFAELDARLENEFEQMKADVRAELDRAFQEFVNLYNELKHQVELDVANMKYEFLRLESELREAITGFRVEMVEYIDARFAEFIANLPDYENLIVHNPVKGTDTTIQEALNDLYSSFNVFGLTARQFDSLELTAEEFDGKELTAREFDSMGYKLLGYPDPNYYMLDPFSGTVIPVKDVVMKLFALHAGGLTAGEFDSEELTAEGFDEKEVTAFYFDFFGIPA